MYRMPCFCSKVHSSPGLLRVTSDKEIYQSPTQSHVSRLFDAALKVNRGTSGRSKKLESVSAVRLLE